MTVQSEDVVYGFTIDAYRLSKRVPAGGSVSFEFLADREGMLDRSVKEEGVCGRPDSLATIFASEAEAA